MTDQMFLIRKRGLYYRPNSQGYTSNTAEAGRYTKQEAERITHPNGKTGPRDGMDYIPAPEPQPAMTDPTTPTASPLPADVPGLVERATAAMDGVTPGPWSDKGTKHEDWSVDTGGDNSYCFVGPKGKRPVCIPIVDSSFGKDGILDANTRFIAAARQLVPDLMAALQAQAQQIAGLTAERDRFEAALARACLVGGTTYLIERAEKAEAERDSALAQNETLAMQRDTTAMELQRAEAEVARLREALDNLLDAIMAQDRFGDRALTITGPTAALKWLIEAGDAARAALKGGDNG